MRFPSSRPDVCSMETPLDYLSVRWFDDDSVKPFRNGIRVQGRLSDAVRSVWSATWDSSPTVALESSCDSWTARLQRTGSTSTFFARINGIMAEIVAAPQRHRGRLALSRGQFVAGLAIEDFQFAPVFGHRTAWYSLMLVAGQPGSAVIRLPSLRFIAALNFREHGWLSSCTWSNETLSITMTASPSVQNVTTQFLCGAIRWEATLGTEPAVGATATISPTVAVRAGLVRSDSKWNYRLFVVLG